MNLNIKNKAFTLVELIVVITILAILATISYVAVIGYFKDARDSVRFSDLSNIKKFLEVSHEQTGKFPLPTNGVDIFYSGSLMWTQGTFGIDTIRAIGGTLNSIPNDPLKLTEYSYSVTEDKQEYQLGIGVEGFDILSKYISIIGFGSELKTFLTGNFNGKILIKKIFGVDNIFALPSIIASNLSSNDFIDIINNKNLTFNGYLNLPDSYNLDLEKEDDGNFGFSENDILVFSGNIEDLNDQENRMNFYRDISDVYIYSDLQGLDGYKEFSQGFIDKFNPTFDYINIACLTVENLLRKDFGCIVGVDETIDITQGDAFTGMLLDNGETNYIGQWLFGDSFSTQGQSLGNADHDRTTMGMSGGLNKSIGLKWKLFTKNKSPQFTFGGYDIDNLENTIFKSKIS